MGALRRYLQTASEFESCRQDRAIRDEWLQAFELFGMAPVVPEWAPLFAYAGQLDLDCGVMSERELPHRLNLLVGLLCSTMPGHCTSLAPISLF